MQKVKSGTDISFSFNVTVTDKTTVDDIIKEASNVIKTRFADIEVEPEESEDERIRKELIEFINHYRHNTDLTTEQAEWCKKAITYLEKQKEHQKNCTKFLAKILKHSAEGFRNVLKKKGVDYIPHESFWTNTAGTFSKQECNEFYKWMDDMTMELVTEETPEYKKGFKDGKDSEKQKEPHYTKRNALFDKCVENCDPKTVKEVNKRVDDIMNMPELSAFEQALTNFIGYWEDDEERWPSQFVKKYGKHILDMAREELQKEQNPVEYLPKQKVFDIMNKLTELSYSERIPIDSEEYIKIHEITLDVNSLLDYPIKPAKWREEDELMRTAVIQTLERFGGRGTTGMQIDWLKSLPLDLKKKNEDVAKLCSNEWNKEDEEKLVRLLDAISIGNDYNEMRNWLLQKLKSLRSRPKSSDNWKPSEGQIEALKCAVEDVAKFSKRGGRQVELENEPYYRSLHSLYEQLKKL